MENIKAIIFDMDGILIDTERISFNAFKSVLKEYDYEMSEKFYLTMIGRNVKSIEQVMKAEYGQDFPFDEVYKKKVHLCVSTIDRDGVIIKKGVHELIDYLNENNYKIAVATSTRKERAHKLLADIGIKEKVNYIICGDQVENSKPDPEIFLKAAEKLGVVPEECIVVEDSAAGIKGAYDGKMLGFHVEDLKAPDEDILKYAYKTFKNLDEIREYLSSQLT